MKDEQLAELKQFITTTIAASENRLSLKFDIKIDALEARLEARMDEGFAAVGDTLEEILKYVDGRFMPRPRWFRG